MQINRLFEIVYILMEKKSVTARELAEHFEVSGRTILRDVETLAQSGIPVYTTQGRGGGICLMEGYVLNKAAMTDDEQNTILIALQSLKAVENLESGKLLDRLGGLFQKRDRSWIEVDFSAWGRDASADNRKFETLKSAIAGGLAVEFLYYNSLGEKGLRRVYPLKLVCKNRAWYMQGFCLAKEDYRTFKLTRMREVSPTNERFDARRFTPPALESDSAAQSPIELRFDGRWLYRLYDYFNDEEIRPRPDGYVDVCVSMPFDSSLCPFLLSFGDAVEVIAPNQLRDMVAGMARRVANKYDQPEDENDALNPARTP